MSRLPPERRARARQLRRDQTDAESHMWWILRSRQVGGLKFRRQHPIGPFVADFCCVERRLVIELDGGQHVERARADAERSAYLAQQGFTVLRFWNDDVLVRTYAVAEAIVAAAEK